MQPHYSQSSREDATPSSGTSPLASYKEVHYGQLEIQILITVCFVTPSFALVPSLPECEKRSLMTRIKLWCTVIAVSIHVTSGVIFLRFFVFPKWCVQVGTVEVHMSCVRIQLHWWKNNIVKGKTWRTSCKKKNNNNNSNLLYANLVSRAFSPGFGGGAGKGPGIGRSHDRPTSKARRKRPGNEVVCFHSSIRRTFVQGKHLLLVLALSVLRRAGCVYLMRILK